MLQNIAKFLAKNCKRKLCMCIANTGHRDTHTERERKVGVKYQTSFCQKINIYVHLQNEENRMKLNPQLRKQETQANAEEVVHTFTPIAIKSLEVGNMIA